MINKKYNVLCKEIEKTIKIKNRAIKRGDTKLEEACSARISEIMGQIKANMNFFVSIPDDEISFMFKNEKTYNKVMDEKEIYVEKQNAINSILDKDEIELSDVKKLKGKSSKKGLIAKIALGTAIVAALAGGVSSCNKNNKEENEPTKTTESTEEIKEEPITTEEMEIEYTEKEGAVVRFTEPTEKNTTTTTNTDTTYDNDKKDDTTDKKDTNDNKDKEDKNKDKKDNKDKEDKDKKDNKDKENTKEDTTTEDKTEENTTTEETTTEENPDEDLENKEEVETDVTIEEPAPEVPGDMPIEEDENNKNNDEQYYDIDGNESTKEEADKSYEESNNKDAQNSDNNVTTEENPKTEEQVEQTTPDVQDGMEVDGENEVYYDINGNETTKEEADKSYEEDEKESLISQYNAIRAELEQLQQVIATQEDTNTLILNM